MAKSSSITRSQFFKTLGEHITRDRTIRKASRAEMALVCAYVRSLVFGDGSVPDGLSTKVADSVRFRFAMGVAHKAPDGTMAGQRQDWFADTLIKAQQAKQACIARAAAHRQQRATPLALVS